VKDAERIDDIIIDIFKENMGEFVSGQVLSRRIKITRSAVWKHIEGLRRQGYVILSAPSKGYRLVEVPDRLSASEVKRGIHTKTIGKEILIFDEVGSTNDIAMELGAKGGEDGLVVVAESQSHGKGRLGRTWISPKGVNLYVSVLLRPEFSPHHASALTMMASVATATAISRVTGLVTEIKWPNDILIGGKKVSGILTEMHAEGDRIHYVVIGVGVNVNMKREDFPDNLRMPAASLMEYAGRKIDRNELLRALLESMDSNLEMISRKGIVSIVPKWRRLCGTLNRRVKISLPGEAIIGVAEDVTQEGGLIVTIGEGAKRVVYAGDLTILE